MSLPCCYVSEETPYCVYRRVEGLPMCQKHMHQTFRDAIYDWLLPNDVLADLVRNTEWAIKMRETTQRLDFHRARDAKESAREAERQARKGDLGVVYYVRLDAERIKIGTSRSLKSRLASMRIRDKDILAVEPGGRGLENDRHHQFQHLRIGRLEEFEVATDLLEHIREVRELWGSPMLVPGAQ